MLNNIFYILLTSLFLSFSVGAMEYSSVNRTFLLLHRGVIESAINTIDESGEPNVYINETKLESGVRDYLDKNLPKYVTNYTLSYYYFYQSDGLICLSHHCDSIKISLKADINYFFHYEKAISFYIHEGKGQ